MTSLEEEILALLPDEMTGAELAQLIVKIVGSFSNNDPDLLRNNMVGITNYTLASHFEFTPKRMN